MRPWKASCAATSFVRPVSRDSLNATSLASAPELQKKTRVPVSAPSSPASPSASAIPGSVAVQVGRVTERVQLPRDSLDDRRVAVPEHVHRDAAEQVEVALAVDVGDDGALSAGQRQRRRAVVVHHHGGPPRPNARRCVMPLTTFVPVPASVNSSTSTQ